MSMLLTSIGQDGSQAVTAFTKNTSCCAAAVFWLSVAVTGNLHEPRSDPRIRHLRTAKTVFTLATFVASTLPLVVSEMSDFFTLVYISATALILAFLHLMVNVASDSIREIPDITQSGTLKK